MFFFQLNKLSNCHLFSFLEIFYYNQKFNKKKKKKNISHNFTHLPISNIYHFYQTFTNYHFYITSFIESYLYMYTYIKKFMFSLSTSSQIVIIFSSWKYFTIRNLIKKKKKEKCFTQNRIIIFILHHIYQVILFWRYHSSFTVLQLQLQIIYIYIYVLKNPCFPFQFNKLSNCCHFFPFRLEIFYYNQKFNKKEKRKMFQKHKTELPFLYYITFIEQSYFQDILTVLQLYMYIIYIY